MVPNRIVHGYRCVSILGEPTSKNPELANGEIEDRYRPRLLVRPIDSVRALIGVTAPDDADFPDRGGWQVVVSIRALVEAQAGKPLTLAEACDLYGLKRPRTAEGLAGLAAEMETLEALYRHAMTLHRKLLPQKPPNPAMSPGTYAQGLLERQGLVPPLARQPNTDRGMLAAWMGSLFSGDVGLGVRGVARIRWFLEDLSPYPPELRPTLNVWDPNTDLPVRIEDPRFLRVEPENHPPLAAGFPTDGLQIQVVSVKRYDPFLVFRPGPHAELTADGPARIVQPSPDDESRYSQIVMRGASRHGITHQPPAGYTDDSWVDEALAADLALKLGIEPRQPQWADDPAISLIPVTRPRIGRSIDAAPYSRIASWRSVLGNGTTAITHAHTGLDPEHAPWIDADTADPITPHTRRGSASEFGFIGDNYNTAIARLRRTPEPTVITPNNQPSNPTTRGIVKPAPTNATGVALIGRESRRWRNHTPQGKPDHITYQEADTWPHHLAALKRIAKQVGQKPLANAIGISERTLRNLLGRRPPSKDTKRRVVEFLVI